MLDLVFDIETNGLLRSASILWIFVGYDIKTGKKYTFSDWDDDPEVRPLKDLPKFLDEEVRMLIGHNIMTFDIPAMKKLLGWEPKKHHKLVDTLIMSQVQNYNRFGFGHSLEKWGQSLGYHKQEHEDWNNYSAEMRSRCTTDVELNVKVYNALKNELNGRKNKDRLKLAIRVEHAVSRFVGIANLHGWPFDIKKARELYDRIALRMLEIEDKVEPHLSLVVYPVDAKAEPKSPAYVKSGWYAKRTADWFEVDPAQGKLELWRQPIWGDYCRVGVEKPGMGQLESVKAYLYKLGWEPTEWNINKITKQATTPKITEDSLEGLGEIGELIGEYYSIKARQSILRTWIEENYDPVSGRIYGDCFVIGTPTGRARHNVIANIPSADATLGKEVRELFTVEPGYKMIGADSSSNQNRLLCFYLNNDEYTQKVIATDIHTANLEVLEKILGSLGSGGRRKAKAFFYALIFGGGDGKLGLILTGRRDAKVGKTVRSQFLRSIKGFDKLVAGLVETVEATAKTRYGSYITSLDGRPIFTNSKHKALNYLLQSGEKATVAAAIELGMQYMEDHGIAYYPLIMYHDEVEVMVREKDAEKAAALWKLAFKEGPKVFGVGIMDGDAKVGYNWYDVH